MLKALLWKEWRETRALVFLCAALAVAVSLFSLEEKIGVGGVVFLYLLIWGFFAMLVATVLFCGERESGTMSWLGVHPAAWWRIWGAKMLYGLLAQCVFGGFLCGLALIWLVPSESLHLNSVVSFFTDETLPFGVVAGLFSIYSTACLMAALSTTSLKAVVASCLAWPAALYLGAVMTFACLSSGVGTYLFFAVLPVLSALALVVVSHDRFRAVKLRLLILGGVAAVSAVMVLRTLGLLSLIMMREFYTSGAGVLELGIVFALLNEATWLSLLAASGAAAFLSCGFVFAFGRKKDRLCWRHRLAGGNMYFLVATCLTTALLSLFSLCQTLDDHVSGFCHDVRSDPFLHPLAQVAEFHMMDGNRLRQIPTRHLLLDTRTGTVRTYGKAFPALVEFMTCSPDKRRVIYGSPVFRWGLAWDWGVWAEEFDSGTRRLLTTYSTGFFSGGWVRGGERLVLVMAAESSGNPVSKIMSFSFDEEKTVESLEIPGYFHVIDIVEDTGELYLFNSETGLVMHLAPDLREERVIRTVHEKCTEISDTDDWYPYPVVSQDRSALLFRITANGEKRQQLWSVSLQDGTAARLCEAEYVYHYSPFYFGLSGAGSAFGSFFVSHSRDGGVEKLWITDVRRAESSAFMTAPDLDFLGWTGDGHLLVKIYLEERPGSVEFRLLRLHPDLSCEVIFSFRQLECFSDVNPPPEALYPARVTWSPDRSRVVLYRGPRDKSVWYLDTVNEKLAQAVMPENFETNYLQIGDNGEFYAIDRAQLEIYRINTDNAVEIIPY